ncbi:MAG: glucuronate isomerase [Vicinamibacteria bacterium]|nr:glucuronate isomerase [Vicinamibacteria bacterium]
MSGSAFIKEDFLLETDLARHLFHDVAKDLPIIDYHCHLPPDQIRENHKFRSITEIWLDGDHYKWRAMRANGVSERYCTGDATDFEKFEAWAKTVPETIRNPLYHWTHMELKKPFGIEELLNASSARSIYDRTTARLQEEEFTTLGLLKQFKVAVVCTTDDPVDSLEHHAELAKRKDPATRVCPTWRPDKALAIESPAQWNAWVGALEAANGTSIATWSQFMAALERRHSAFHELGCRASDHGLERMSAEPFTDSEIAISFDALRSGRALDALAAEKFKSALLHHLALLDHHRGWVQQFHLGALRNTNARARRTLGPDKGFDSIGDFDQAVPLARFLDRLDDSNQLAKTILYNLNPRDNELFASMIGNFQDGSVPGKMQYGAAWWFLDQKDGMEAQLRALSNLGLFSRFVGMITDSRSFLSYSRHEYYRRLVCNLLGNDVRSGFLPDDRELLTRAVRNVCFENAKAYLGLPLGTLGESKA